MSTMCQGFKYFPGFSHHFCIGQISRQQYKGYMIYWCCLLFLSCREADLVPVTVDVLEFLIRHQKENRPPLIFSEQAESGALGKFRQMPVWEMQRGANYHSITLGFCAPALRDVIDS